MSNVQIQEDAKLAIRNAYSPLIDDSLYTKEEPAIDVSTLEPGMVFKSYVELCKALGEEVRDGNSKTHQMKEWQRYFAWDSKSRRYVITKVYKQPLPRMLSDKATYAKFMQLILMRVLLSCGTGTYYYYPNTFWELSGMVDNEFKEVVRYYNLNEEGNSGHHSERYNYYDYNDKNAISKEIVRRYKFLDKEDLNDLLNITRKRLNEITATALKSLEASALIHYENEYAVKLTSWNFSGGFRTATNDEIKQILNAEQKALKDFHLTNKYIGYARNGLSFKKTVNKYLHENNNQLYGSIRRVRIIYHQPSIEYYNMVVRSVVNSLMKNNYMDQMFAEDEGMIIEFCKIALNDLIIDALLDQAKKDQSKALSKINEDEEWGRKKSNKYLTYCGSNHFLSDFLFFVDNAVKIKTNSRMINYDEYDDYECVENNKECQGVEAGYSDEVNDELDLFSQN
jgi:hypothetical protein